MRARKQWPKEDYVKKYCWFARLFVLCIAFIFGVGSFINHSSSAQDERESPIPLKRIRLMEGCTAQEFPFYVPNWHVLNAAQENSGNEDIPLLRPTALRCTPSPAPTTSGNS